MSGRYSGGAAFPMPVVIDAYGDAVNQPQSGMTLRDWFAGQALASFNHTGWPDSADAPEMARRAFVIADAMLAERAK